MSDAFTLFNEGVTASMQAHEHRAAGAVDDAARCDKTALDCFDRTLAIEPEHVGALGGKAMSLAQLGRTKDAIAAFDVAIAVEPVPEFYRQLGLCQVELGDMQQAWIATRQAVALDDSRETRENAAWELLRFGANVEQLIDAHASEMTDEQRTAYHQWAASIYALACETDDQNMDAPKLLSNMEAKLEQLSGEQQ